MVGFSAMSTKRLVQATFRVVTPLFLGGADQQRGELRAASFKGALAFWWRALQNVTDPVELRSREADLFGGSEVGRSRVRLDLIQEPGFSFKDPGTLDLSAGLGYLAGQGLAKLHPERPGSWTNSRGFVVPGSRFVVRAVLEQSRQEEIEFRSLLDSFRALAIFGGLGSRARRGFGSLRLERLLWDGGSETGPESIRDLSSYVPRLLAANASPGLPPYTSFSNDSRVIALEGRAVSSAELLDEVGSRFQELRSFRRTGGMGHQDCSEMHGWLTGVALGAPPRRAVFGLPHNYRFRSSGTKVGIEPDHPEHGRRASPLFFHVDEVGEAVNRRGVVVLTFLPATFLPASEMIAVKSSARKTQRLSPRAAPNLWGPINEFLDGLLSRPSGHFVQTLYPPAPSSGAP